MSAPEAETVATTSPDEVTDGSQQSLMRRIGRNEHLGLIIALAILFIFLSLFAPYFLTERNLMNTLQQASFLGIIALAMTLVILAAEIDISVGSAMALYSALLGVLTWKMGWPIWLAALLILLLGTSIGMGAGWVRARFNVPSFIVTLALLSALRGFGLWMTNASPIAIPDKTFQFLGSGRIGGFELAELGFGFRGVPFPVIVFVVFFVIFWFIAAKTTFGRSVYAVGGNPEAARISGISLMRVRVAIFAGTGLMAAISAILISSLIGSGNAGVGQGAEFKVIAAVIVGGTSLYGGRGSMFGTLLGVLFIAFLTNGMVLMGWNQYAQQVAHGFIILIAVLASTMLRGGGIQRWRDALRHGRNPLPRSLTGDRR
jgi:simple sugar transport system permease protein